MIVTYERPNKDRSFKLKLLLPVVIIGHAQIWDPSNPGREIASTQAQSQWQAWPI